jgi:hypothetical protein
MKFRIIINAFEGKRPVHFIGEMDFDYRPSHIAILAYKLEGNPERRYHIAEVTGDIAIEHHETDPKWSQVGTLLARSRKKGIVEALGRKKEWQKGEGHHSIYTALLLGEEEKKAAAA